MFVNRVLYQVSLLSAEEMACVNLAIDFSLIKPSIWIKGWLTNLFGDFSHEFYLLLGT